MLDLELHYDIEAAQWAGAGEYVTLPEEDDAILLAMMYTWTRCNAIHD